MKEEKNTGEKRNECDQHLYARVGAMKWTVINGHGSLHEQDDRLWIYVSGNSKSHYHEMWLWTGAQINIYTCAPVNMNLDCFMINWIGFLRHRLNTKLWPQSMFLMLYCILKEVHYSEVSAKISINSQWTQKKYRKFKCWYSNPKTVKIGSQEIPSFMQNHFTYQNPWRRNSHSGKCYSSIQCMTFNRNCALLKVNSALKRWFPCKLLRKIY